MKELAMAGDRRMTVREVAEALNVADRTIRDNVSRLFPGIARDGVTTYLTESQVTAIKQAIERSGRNDLANVRQVAEASTELEMMMLDAKVSAWKNHKIEELTEINQGLKSELAVAAPKAELADRIASADGLKSLSEVGKINGIGPRKIFDILVGLRIIYRSGRSWVPYQDYIDSGAFVVRESTYEANGIDHLYSKTYVTGKGELWLARRLFAEATA